MADDGPKVPIDRYVGGIDLAVRVFMTEVAVQLAQAQPDPDAWARRFIADLHDRLARIETQLSPAGAWEGKLAHARERLDILAQNLGAILAGRGR